MKGRWVTLWQDQIQGHQMSLDWIALWPNVLPPICYLDQKVGDGFRVGVEDEDAVEVGERDDEAEHHRDSDLLDGSRLRRFQVEVRLLELVRPPLDEHLCVTDLYDLAFEIADICTWGYLVLFLGVMFTWDVTLSAYNSWYLCLEPDQICSLCSLMINILVCF